MVDISFLQKLIDDTRFTVFTEMQPEYDEQYREHYANNGGQDIIIVDHINLICT